MKMLCFPHAGGFSFSYYFLKLGKINGLFPEDVILYEYPHRGARLKEEQYKYFEECVNAIVDEYEQELEDNNYVLFGQSLGGYLAYEVGLILKNKYNKSPAMVIVSGQMPPCYAKEYVVDYTDSKELNKYLKRMDVSKEFLDKTGSSYINLVCDDLKMFGSYEDNKKSDYLKLPKAAIVYGKEDPDIRVESLNEWSDYIENVVDIKGFNGKHFFFNQCREDFVSYLNELMLKNI